MGCCLSTPSTSSSPRTAPYDDNPSSNTRVITNHPPGNDSGTAGSTSHAAPGLDSSQRNTTTTTDTNRRLSHYTSHERSRPGAGAGIDATSPTNDVPNKPLKAPPPRNKIPIPALLTRQSGASLPRLSSFSSSADNTNTNNNNGSVSPAITSPISTTLPRITRSQLERERSAFFDTRWAGRAEVWAAVRAVCENMRQGDVEGAQTMLDAAGLTCPSGEVWSANADMPDAAQAEGGQRGWRRRKTGKGDGGVYDEWGERYQVPLWVVADPEEVDEDGAAGQKHAQERSREDEGEAADTDDEDEDDIILSKEKGKAPDTGKVIKVRARLSDRGTDVVLRIGLEESVAALRRKIKESAELPPRSRIKVVYLGKILSPSISLNAQGWCEGHVVNAMIFNPP